MSTSLADIQEVIDIQFQKLEQAVNGGQVNQLVHGLRIQIRKKVQLGGHLTAREEQIYGHRDTGAPNPSRWAQILAMAILLVLLLAAAWYIWKHAL